MDIKKYMEYSVETPKIFLKNQGDRKTWMRYILDQVSVLPCFEIKSLLDLAVESVQKEVHDKKIIVMDAAYGGILVESILSSMQEKKEENFFIPHGLITYATAKEIYKSYVALAGSEWEHPLNEDLVKIFKGIEEEVVKINRTSASYYITEPGLLHRATEVFPEKMTKSDQGELLLEASLRPSKIALSFLKVLTNRYKVRLLKAHGGYEEEVLRRILTEEGIDVLETVICQKTAKREQKKFSYHGSTKEIQGVFKHMVEHGYPVDRCEVLYTDVKYQEELYRQCRDLKIPVESDGGDKISHSEAYVFVKEMMAYLTEKFDIRCLGNMVHTIQIQHESVRELIEGTLFTLEEPLRKSIYGLPFYLDEWQSYMVKYYQDQGFRRIEAILEEHKPHFLSNARKLQEEILSVSKDTSEKLDFKAQKELCYYLFTVGLWRKIKEGLNGADTPQNMQNLFAVVMELLKMQKVKNHYEGMAKGIILGKLTMVMDLVSPKISSFKIENFLDMLRDEVAQEKEQKKYGAFRIRHIAKAAVLQRHHVFLVGLDATRYPVKILESPITSDQSLEAIGCQEETSIRKNAYQKNLLENLLSTGEGTICLSYARRDFSDGAIQSPAVLWTKTVGASMHKIKEDEEGQREARTPLEALHMKFRHLPKVETSCTEESPGEEMEADSEEIKIEDSTPKLSDNKEVIKEKEESTLFMSASQLDVANECLYKYYLKYVMRIETPREITAHNKWLSAAEKGILIHSVLKTFVDEIIEELWKVEDDEACRKSIYAILSKQLNELKRKNPPKNEYWYQREEEQARTHLLKYVERLRKEYESTWHPYKTEFAIEEDIAIGESIVKVQGSIDRIDIREEADGRYFYRIVDYKTGQGKYLKLEKKLQNALYDTVVDVLVKKGSLPSSLCLKEAGYEMIFDPDLTEKMVEDSIAIEEKKNEMNHLISKIIHKNFQRVAHTEQGSTCKFCDYQEVCRRKEVKSDGF